MSVYRLKPMELRQPQQNLSMISCAYEFFNESTGGWEDAGSSPDTTNALITWADYHTVSIIDAATLMSSGVDNSAGIPVPDIIELTVDDVDTLNLGGVMPYAVVGEEGTILDLPVVTFESDGVHMDLQRYAGRMRVFTTDTVTVDHEIVDVMQSIPLGGTCRVCGRLLSDGTVVRDWDSVQHIAGSTYVTVSDMVGETAKILTKPSVIVPVTLPASTAYARINGSYPMIKVADNGYEQDAFVYLYRSYTMVEAGSTNFYVMFAPWVYRYASSLRDAVEGAAVGSPVDTYAAMRIFTDWSSLVGRPGSTPAQLDSAVNMLFNILDPAALVEFSKTEDVLKRGGQALDNDVTVNSDGGTPETFTIDLSLGTSFIINPTGDYIIEFIGRSAFTREFTLLVKAAGAWASEWNAVIGSMDGFRGVDGCDVFRGVSIPVPADYGTEDYTHQVVVKHMSGWDLT